MSAKTLKSEVVAAAVATSGCGPEGVEVVEGAEVEQAFGRLEHLYAQLPAMEEKGAALARARSAATVDGLAKAAAYRAAELVRADALVTEAEARVSAAEAEGEQAAGEARLALMAAGTQRGLRVGPAQNAEQALARALEASPFDTVEEARAAMLPAESLAALAAEVEAYQAAYAAALAVCQQLEDCEEPEGLEQSTASQPLEGREVPKTPRSTRACGALVRRPPTNSARALPSLRPLPLRAARLPGRLFWSA